MAAGGPLSKLPAVLLAQLPPCLYLVPPPPPGYRHHILVTANDSANRAVAQNQEEELCICVVYGQATPRYATLPFVCPWLPSSAGCPCPPRLRTLGAKSQSTTLKVNQIGRRLG